MRLVTFRIAGGREARAPVPGALVDGGTNALDRAYEALRHSPDALALESVALLAPIPHPPQMRDFLCFEKHLVQAFGAIGKDPPKAWYERPIFYHPNRFSVCGPDADELPDPYRLEMTVRVNGEERGRGNSREMRWKFEDCIAHASRSETLHSGEFFGSGTVGNGSGPERLRFLEAKHVVELEVEGIGVLRNRVVK